MGLQGHLVAASLTASPRLGQGTPAGQEVLRGAAAPSGLQGPDPVSGRLGGELGRPSGCALQSFT